MKHFLFFISALLMLTTVQAQTTDLGLEIWKAVFAAGDIDNDGDLDFIVSGEQIPGDIEAGGIFINDGAGNFTVQSGERVITGGRGGNINFGDINGDGHLDVIFTGWALPNPVKSGIALNDGKGNFSLADTEKYPVLTGTAVVSCGFADFDLNGLMDYYFFGNGPGNCVIFFQNADGSFTPNAEAIKTTVRFGADVGAPIAYNLIEPEVSIIDFNNDGYPDMWINAADLNYKNEGEQTQRFSYLFTNDGFGILSQYSGANVPFKKANGTATWADVNGDGYPDLLLNGDGWLNSGEDDDMQWRLFENVSGTSINMRWEKRIARQGGVGNGSLLVDWDNDGKLDIFTGGWNDALHRQEVALFLGEDPANFTFTRSSLSDTYFQGASEQGLLAADLNGDKKVDLLFNGFCGAPLNKRAAGFTLNQSANASVLPGAPTGLSASIIADSGETMVEFKWTEPTSAVKQYGFTYNLSLKNSTTGKWLYNPMAVVGGDKNGWRKVGGKLGNVFYNKSYELYNLPPGEYEWTVQAINGAQLGGAFAPIQKFTITGTSVGEVNSIKANIYSQDGSLFVKDDSGERMQVRIFSVSGAKLAESEFVNDFSSKLSKGVYIIQLENSRKEKYNAKIVLN